MFEAIGGFYHRSVDPLAEMTLSSLPQCAFYTKYISRLSYTAEQNNLTLRGLFFFLHPLAEIYPLPKQVAAEHSGRSYAGNAAAGE